MKRPSVRYLIACHKIFTLNENLHVWDCTNTRTNPSIQTRIAQPDTHTHTCVQQTDTDRRKTVPITHTYKTHPITECTPWECHAGSHASGKVKTARDDIQDPNYIIIYPKPALNMHTRSG